MKQVMTAILNRQEMQILEDGNMSLTGQETLEDVRGWLLSNEALKGTDEYAQKGQLFLNLHDEGNNTESVESKKQLKNWLLTNSDKKGSAEYNAKAANFIELSDAPEQVTAGQAFRRGALQGATFEFADEIKAGASAAAAYLTDNPSGQSFSDLYAAKKDEENALLAQYKEEQFGSYLGGQVTGGIATLPLGGLFGKAGQLAFGVGGRGATAGQTALRAGAAGATQSGLTGLGMGEDFESRLKGAALGIGVGGVLGGGLGAGGYKLAEKVANSSNGLVNRAAKLGGKPRSTVEVSEELAPQLAKVAESAKAARDAAYTGWRDKLQSIVDKSGKKFFKDTSEDGAPQVIPTGALKAMVNGMQGLVTDQKNINAILQEADNVTVDTYKNLYKTAWDLQKQLAKNKAVPFAKNLKDIEGFEYKHLDSLFPKKGLGTARQSIDKAVKDFETGQLLNEQLVMKIAKGEPLEAAFAKQFLPNNSKSFENYTNLKTRVNSWAKEAGVSAKEVDEILAPLRANALSDAINDPKLLGALGKTATSEQLTVLKHYKELLTPEQFKFVSSLSKMPANHIQNRMTSLLDYYSSAAFLGLGGIGVGATALTAGGGAGLAVLGMYMASPVLINAVTKNKQLLALATKIISSPLDTPPKELTRMTNNLGKAALKAGIITPSMAISTLNSLTDANKEVKNQ